MQLAHTRPTMSCIHQYFDEHYQFTILFITNCRSDVATSVALLFKQSRRGKSRKEWLRAVPLYHFLKASSEPFEKLGMGPEKIRFNADHELGLDDFKNKTYDSEEGYVQYLYATV